jgi:hypothetical protein
MFLEPSLALLCQKPPSSPKWIHEIKYDGYPMQARIELLLLWPMLKTVISADRGHRCPRGVSYPVINLAIELRRAVGGIQFFFIAQQSDYLELLINRLSGAARPRLCHFVS